MSKKYILTMSAEQAQVLISALDLYSRIGIGQFEEVLDVYDESLKIDPELRDMAKRDINHMKALLGHPANGSYGIHNKAVNDNFRVAYDMQQVVRHCLAWDHNPKGTFQVNFDEPRQISQVTLATIKSEEE